MNSTATDFSKLNIPLSELQAYLDTEREAQERAAREDAQAQRDQLLFEREALIQAQREAEAAARAAGDPNIRGARVVAELVGDRWPELMLALNRVNPARFVNELLKLNSERESKARHASLSTAGRDRVAAEEAAVAARKVRVDGELARLGIRDVTPDEDPA